MIRRSALTSTIPLIWRSTCYHHSVAHLMCFRYAVHNDLKLLAISVRKWSKRLTEFPIVRFVTHNGQAQCRSVLKDICSHLCINDVAVRGALVDSGHKPFVLHCQTQQGGLCDIINNVLIETHVDLVAGRLSCIEWLRHTATRGGLRNAPRWLEAALVPGCFQPQCRSYTEFQLIADGDIILKLDISRIETPRKLLQTYVITRKLL